MTDLLSRLHDWMWLVAPYLTIFEGGHTAYKLGTRYSILLNECFTNYLTRLMAWLKKTIFDQSRRIIAVAIAALRSSQLVTKPSKSKWNISQSPENLLKQKFSRTYTWLKEILLNITSESEWSRGLECLQGNELKERRVTDVESGPEWTAKSKEEMTLHMEWWKKIQFGYRLTVFCRADKNLHLRFLKHLQTVASGTLDTKMLYD